MASRVPPWAWISSLSFLAAFALAGHAAPPNLIALPTPIAPGTEVLAAAAKAGLPIGSLALSPEPGTARIGDGVVALITLTNGSTQKQWILQFEIDRLRGEEGNSIDTLNMNVSSGSGRKLSFSSKSTFALKIKAIGPFSTQPNEARTSTKVTVEKNTRVLSGPDLLAIGIDRACRALIDQGVFSLGSNPTALSKFPEAEEKAVLGSVIALTQFFVIAQQTPGLKEIVWEIIDLPSVWSLARGLGKIQPGLDFGAVTIGAVDPSSWTQSPLPLYRYPLNITLNDKPAVNCAFFVTAPNPPLLTTAGILGFTAESPSHKNKRMLVQIVSAYRGKEAIDPAATLSVVP